MILLVESEDPNQTVDVQDDLGRHCLHMLEETFPHGMVIHYDQSYSFFQCIP